MKKKSYQAPEVVLMDCKVERGFAGSGPNHVQIEGWDSDDAIFF